VPKLPSIGLVGVGYWGKNLARSFDQLGALAAICDSSSSTSESYQDKYPNCKFFNEYSSLLKDDSIEAIAIATPAEMHAKMVEQALLAGKDVLVEKPLSLDLASARALVTLARQKQRILMVGHLLWYHPAIVKLKELVDSGELGRIQYIYSNRLNLGKIRREENILWSFAPHDISVILGLLKEMPDRILAQGGNYLNQNIADVTVSSLSFPSGVKAHVFVSWLHPFKEQKLVVVGDKKMAVFNDLYPDRKLVTYAHSIQWKEQIPVAGRAEAQEILLTNEEPLLTECSHFLKCVQTRQTPRTDGEEAIRVLSVLDMCQKAMDTTGVAEFSELSRTAPARTAYQAHPSAFIDADVEIGEGTSIWHVSHVLEGSRIGTQCRIGQNVVIGPRAVVGNNVKIQNNVSVYEGVTLEDDVFCGPSMVFTNVINPRSEIPRKTEYKKTRVRRGATLGANCTIVCGNDIGTYAFVGAGAVVTRDVPDYALVVGNPAKFHGWMCRCGTQVELKKGRARCTACKTEYRENGKQGLKPVDEKESR
jgi:UDP-2-acetamido-3-amino-2,3-dideoxy-glucuronate N-acetyltransferase